MSRALNRQKQPEQERYVQEQYEPRYQEFNLTPKEHLNLDDVIFFGRIAMFTVTTVIICFALLMQNIATFLAFGFALLISAAIVLALSTALSYLLEDN